MTAMIFMLTFVMDGFWTYARAHFEHVLGWSRGAGAAAAVIPIDRAEKPANGPEPRNPNGMAGGLGPSEGLARQIAS